jgi:Domain of Unknown Function (DUF1259)
MAVPPAMGSAQAINFQPTGGGKAAVTGDFVLTAKEVGPVMQALRDHCIEVTALHNHMLGAKSRACSSCISGATTTLPSWRPGSRRRCRTWRSRAAEMAARSDSPPWSLPRGRCRRAIGTWRKCRVSPGAGRADQPAPLVQKIPLWFFVAELSEPEVVLCGQPLGGRSCPIFLGQCCAVPYWLPASSAWRRSSRVVRRHRHHRRHRSRSWLRLRRRPRQCAWSGIRVESPAASAASCTQRRSGVARASTARAAPLRWL